MRDLLRYWWDRLFPPSPLDSSRRHRRAMEALERVTR